MGKSQTFPINIKARDISRKILGFRKMEIELFPELYSITANDILHFCISVADESSRCNLDQVSELININKKTFDLFVLFLQSNKFLATENTSTPHVVIINDRVIQKLADATNLNDHQSYQ